MQSIDYNNFSLSSSMPKISIITCFNNREILEENLLKSLRQQQNVSFELVLIDNTENKFLSVTSAYNFGAKQATGEYLMFVHQDVYLQGDDWLNQALNYLGSLLKVGAIGVSGVTSNGEPTGFILDRGRFFGKHLSAPIPVQTLDEQLIIAPRAVFEKILFDERFSFHSYGADYSLAVERLGLKVYVLPLMVEHNSLTTSSLAASSLKEQDALLLKKYANSYKKIHKTTGTVGTKKDLLRQKIVFFYPYFLFVLSSSIFKIWGVNTRQKKVLDIGCIPMEQIILSKCLSKKSFSVGISPKKRFLLVSKKLKVHDDYVVADPEKLPFKKKSFDIAFLSGLLEYLPKNTAENTLRLSEEVAKGNVIKVPCSGSPVDNAHKFYISLWSRDDFKKTGYKTFIISFKHLTPRTLYAYKNSGLIATRCNN
jgi:glycosyltransferase involved in cell wall biosynthesis